MIPPGADGLLSLMAGSRVCQGGFPTPLPCLIITFMTFLAPAPTLYPILIGHLFHTPRTVIRLTRTDTVITYRIYRPYATHHPLLPIST